MSEVCSLLFLLGAADPFFFFGYLFELVDMQQMGTCWIEYDKCINSRKDTTKELICLISISMI